MQSTLLALLAGRRGHFRMESGYHSETWYDLDAVLARRAQLAPFLADFARRLAPHRPDVICGPETGGARLAEALAPLLGVPAVAADRLAPPPAPSPGLFPVRYAVRAADHARLAGRRVALVDDAISAGSAIRGSHASLVAAGAVPVVVGALFVFGGGAADFAARHGLALEFLAAPDYRLWLPEQCPHCARGVPVESVSDAPPSSPPPASGR